MDELSVGNDITENLHTFDTNSTARLEPLKSDIAVMQNYISKITDLFQQKSIDIANYYFPSRKETKRLG
ncbi:T7SS effector LXG polymorphic toxin [Paucisalibacillus globulus]|uniref:T7SS effector LXG polymorphic toxin n=1 Tax=Paucisalibacillus globulus TaxID=351095 RepID=UPI00047C7539|nr:T7SS effector LXG polymorphic toxin [Paucisalibacillus globulus]